MKCIACVAAFVALGLTAGRSMGATGDQPLTADSFSHCFGGAVATQEAPADVRLTRTLSGVDAGCDYGKRIVATAAHARVEMQPIAPVNGGFYTVTVLFFGADGAFLRETVWVPDTQSRDLQVIPDVRRLARDEGVPNAASYLLRFRVQPFEFSGPAPAFRFRSIAIRAARPEATARWNIPGPPPHLVTHYMGWYEIERSPNDPAQTWEFWKWNGPGPAHDPTTRRLDGRRDIASVLYPLIGPYRSWSRAVVRYHLQTARAAGIRAFLVDWYGPGSRVDERLPLLLDEAARAGLRVAICYEEKINFFPEYRQLHSRAEVIRSVAGDLLYVLQRYGRHPAYLKRDGKPFVFQFNAWGSSPELGAHGLTPGEFAEVFQRLPGPLTYGRQNLDEAYHPPIRSAYTWWAWQYAELEQFGRRARWLQNRGRLEFFMSMISPGFDDTGVWGWGGGPRMSSEYGDPVLAATTARALIGAPELVQIVTWNDFPEGTSIEPTVEYGFRWLDAIEAWWGQMTGRPVNLEDNRRPLARYLRTCSPSERAEITSRAYELLDDSFEVVNR